MPASDVDPEVTKKPFREQIKSLGYVYWLSGWMELVERFAYYGVRVISPLFFVAAFEAGGPQLTQIQKGNIWAVWAIVQSFVPILSGGFADRYGFKVNIAAATVLKIIGYLIMGYTVFLAESFCGMPLAEARAKGADHAFEIFFVGAIFLAFGTAIFKPGLQGLVAMEIPKDSASLGWGLFYQMVNIGSFFGPLLAGYLRVLEWEYVFLACSAAIALNFIPLFMFKEPAREVPEGEEQPGPVKLFCDALRGLLEPRLFFFTLALAGFWLMAMQFFDILPNFIDDWIDARGLASFLTGIFGSNVVPTIEGNLTQEWLVNFNALLISFLAFLVGYVTGKFRSLTNIIAGIVFATAAVYCLGVNMNGWWILACIGTFSLGEMLAAPTQMRYLARIAPPGKAGLYMGYSNFTVGIGWSLGSLLAGHLYETGGDKVVLARRYLVEEAGRLQAEIDAIGKSDLLPFFEKTVGVDAWEARRLLWDTYEPYSMWALFALIGGISLLALGLYNRVVTKADADPNHSLNTKGDVWVLSFLIPVCILFLLATIYVFSIGLLLNTLFFSLMLVFALAERIRKQSAS